MGIKIEGFVTDETGAVIHISSSDILTKESIESWEKETGMELRCTICGSRLQPGDQKDHFWPYFSNYNRCRKCLEKKEVNHIMAVKAKIKHLKPGTVFNAGPVAVRVLEHFPDGKTLVITNECIADRPFTCQPFKPNRPGDWKSNNWRTSTLRADLNRDFLNSFDYAGGPILSENIIPAEWDLTDSAGDNIYGSVTDKIGLLTEAMFRKYSEQGLLDLDDWWWLITPDAGYSHTVRYVNTEGTLGNCDAYCGIRGVRPALYVESEIEVKLEEDEVDLSPSALLEGFTTCQLVEELFRRIGTEKND